MKRKTKKKKVYSLRRRIILSISLLTMIRLGSFIPLPYVDRETFGTLDQIPKATTNNSLGEVLSTFSSGGTNPYSLLSLGIVPYINASIIVQLLTVVIPSLSTLQKEEGEYGRRKLTDLTRYLTFVLAIFESISVTQNLKKLIFNWNFWTEVQIVLVLLTGSMIMVWFSELITRKGLGNGSSLLICFNIICSVPDMVRSFFTSFANFYEGIPSLVLFSILFFGSTAVCIFLNDGVLSIPLISAKQLSKPKIWKNPAKSSREAVVLPLRVNTSGVMPLVFTSYVILISSFVTKVLREKAIISSFLQHLSSANLTFVYWVGKGLFWYFYGALIFVFTYFYSTIVLNPKDLAENFQKTSVIITNMLPGKQTENYLTHSLAGIARVNAFFLIALILGVQLSSSLFHLNLSNIRGVGFTSQIILVNVLIDTLNKARGFLLEEENSLNHEE